MAISIVRLHGEACLICGSTSDDLFSTRHRLQTIGADGTRRTWRTVVCSLHTPVKTRQSPLASTAKRPTKKEMPGAMRCLL
jgi:hypothetical protein